MALKITISGKVHDVGYRLFLLEEADRLFIPKFDARNVRLDGKEALIVLVDGEKQQLDEFLKIVNSERPEEAVVEEIRVEEYANRIRDLESFRSSFNTLQLSKIVSVGLRMLGKQDLSLEKQDMMLEKQDLMLEKQDLMIEKQDIMLEKMDTMLDKQDTMLGKMDLMLEKQDSMLERQDLMLERQDTTIKVIRDESKETRDVLGKKIDEVGNKIDGVGRKVESVGNKVDAVGSKVDLLRMDMKEFMEANMKRIHEEISEIKQALRKAGIM